MIASNRLHSGILRRWVQLQERMLWLEDEYGPNSPQAEKAVKALPEKTAGYQRLAEARDWFLRAIEQ